MPADLVVSISASREAARTPYRFQASTNLVDWVGLSTNTPVDGVFRFVDANAIELDFRFYRAVSP